MSAEDEITEAAYELLSAGGPEAVTVRAVADASSFGRSTVSHYFPTIGSLYDVLYLRVAEAMAVRLATQGFAHGGAAQGFADTDEALTVVTERLQQDSWPAIQLLVVRQCPPVPAGSVLLEMLETFVGGPVAGDPARAIDLVASAVVTYHSYVETVNVVDGHGLADGGPLVEFLSATLRRDSSPSQ